MSWGDRIFTFIIYAFLSIAVIIIIYPLIYVVSASFSDPQAVISGEVILFPVRPTLRGYEAVFKNRKILLGLGNSLYYLVVGTVLNLVMTML